MTNYGIRTEENTLFGRQQITVWSAPFMSTLEAWGTALPRRDGFMLTTYNGDKVRASCPAPRTEENYKEVDAAISAALDAHFTERGAVPMFLP